MIIMISAGLGLLGFNLYHLMLLVAGFAAVLKVAAVLHLNFEEESKR
jgi:hypothetical protein